MERPYKVEKFYFKRSYWEAMRDMPDDQLIVFFKGLMEYVFEGTEPEFENKELQHIFALMRPDLEANIKRCNARRK